jgi:hypothetical protein
MELQDAVVAAFHDGSLTADDFDSFLRTVRPHCNCGNAIRWWGVDEALAGGIGGPWLVTAALGKTRFGHQVWQCTTCGEVGFMEAPRHGDARRP